MQVVQQFIVTFNTKNVEVKEAIQKYHKNFNEINSMAKDRIMKTIRKTESFLKDLEKRLRDGNECYANVEGILKEFCEPEELDILKGLHPFEKVNQVLAELKSLANARSHNFLEAEWKKQKLIYESQVNFQLQSLDEAEKRFDMFYKNIGDLNSSSDGAGEHNFLFKTLPK